MNEQSNFWKGEFGNQYTQRNIGLSANNTAFFVKALKQARGVKSIIELGAGSGQNTHALHWLMPDVQKWSVEINEIAASHIPYGNVIIGDVLSVNIPTVCNLSFTKGLCIHVDPGGLSQLYERLYASSNKYILICEYYNPTPVEIEYRGHDHKLWKRDFAGEMLDIYPDLELIDYGFIYHRDHFPQDDLSFFLMEKKSA